MTKPNNHPKKQAAHHKYTKFSLLQFSLSFKRLNKTTILQGISQSVKNNHINVTVINCAGQEY